MRVLDLTTVLAGPYCTYQLSLLGAEVIKLEKPGTGDWARQGQGVRGLPEFSAQFVAQNAGKKSIELDLKSENGLRQALELAKTCDVVVENFSPGVADRLGIGYEDVRRVKPDVVYCAMSGYGQEGEMSKRPAYDHVIQAASGITMLTGTPESVPNRIGPPLVDYLAGIYGAFAVLAALRERDRTGAPQFLDVAMLDAAVVAMASTVSLCANAGKVPVANGNTAASGSPMSGIFKTRDGLLSMTANQHGQFVRALRAMELEALMEDPRFREEDARQAHAAELKEALSLRLLDKPAIEWERILSEVHVPAAKVRTVPELLGSEHLAQRGTIARVMDERSQVTMEVPAIGFRWNRAPLGPVSGPPRLGEHTEQVLGG
ncbi:CaiB/BaiF CoA transferase family protein [Ottowia sp. VDI28]|uniref:CaiB/BaiF CoA transferase family protein n=1 Tax=Ottowia sp. VDI28 TaxID=3133968 RepID=UPI003C2DABA7